MGRLPVDRKAPADEVSCSHGNMRSLKKRIGSRAEFQGAPHLKDGQRKRSLTRRLEGVIREVGGAQGSPVSQSLEKRSPDRGPD